MDEILSNADRSICVPKRINITRWSCRADASTAFVQGYPEIKNALAEFADNPNEVPKVRCESNGLYERMCLLETGIYSVFWNDILERVNATSRKLHDPKLDLNAAVATVVSLKRFVEAKRETCRRGSSFWLRGGCHMSCRRRHRLSVGVTTKDVRSLTIFFKAH